MTGRYDASGMAEGQFEPGSNGQVLSNKLGITDPSEINDLELRLLSELYDVVLERVLEDQVIRLKDLFEWHRNWLGNLYEWAGKQRSVNLGKGDFYFAAARQIPRCLSEFEQRFLKRYTPCIGMEENELTEAIAVVHVEFVLIHPFREGNGRLARLLANVMALQAGKPELDFSSWKAEVEKYFLAIQAGVGANYEPMKVLVRQALLDAEQGAAVD